MTADLAIVDYLRYGRELLELAASSTDRQLAALAAFDAPITARAAVAEAEDLPPKDRPWCPCSTCQTFLLRVRWERMTGT